jgi:hypothetical protein
MHVVARMHERGTSATIQPEWSNGSLVEETLLSRCIMRRMCDGIQLEDWTRELSGLTHLSLRDVYVAEGTKIRPGVVRAVVPHLTTLRSLVLALDHNYWPNDSGRRCPCCPLTQSHHSAGESSTMHAVISWDAAVLGADLLAHTSSRWRSGSL